MADQETELFRSNAPQERVLAEQAETMERQRDARIEPQLRQLVDSNVTGTAGQRELDEVLFAPNESDNAAEAVAADNAVEAPGTTPLSAPQFAMPEIKKEEDAVPWAIAIDLEKRLKDLSTTTAAVNHELDMLEAAALKLAKRMTS